MGSDKTKRKVLTGKQVREFDRIAIEQFGINSLVLMENAARAATDELCKCDGEANCDVDGPIPSAVILCGRGNNGGDGLVMARHLHLRGWNTKVVLLANPENLSPDSGTNFRILKNTPVSLLTWGSQMPAPPAGIEEALRGFNWIVDALLGTGAKPPLRSPMLEFVRVANRMAVRRMAVDVPSGLDCDAAICGPEDATSDSDGEGRSVFKADLTVTFVALKPVMDTDTGKRHCGEIRIVDIGAPTEIFEMLSTDNGDQFQKSKTPR